MRVLSWALRTIEDPGYWIEARNVAGGYDTGLSCCYKSMLACSTFDPSQMEFIRGGFEVNKVIPGPCRASTLHL